MGPQHDTKEKNALFLQKKQPIIVHEVMFSALIEVSLATLKFVALSIIMVNLFEWL